MINHPGCIVLPPGVAKKISRFFTHLPQAPLFPEVQGVTEAMSGRVGSERSHETANIAWRGHTNNNFVFLTHFCPPLRFRNQVPTFAVRETDVSRHNGGTSGAPLN